MNPNDLKQTLAMAKALLIDLYENYDCSVGHDEWENPEDHDESELSPAETADLLDEVLDRIDRAFKEA